MTGLIKHCLEDCAKLLGLRQNQRPFCPEECILVQAGIATGHLVHCQNDSNTEIAHVLNFLVDLTISSHSVSNETITEKISSLRKRINKLSEDQIERLEEVAKQKSSSSHNKDDNKDLNKAIISLGNRLKSVETKQRDMSEKLTSLIEQIDNLSQDKIISSIKESNSKIALGQNKEFEKLKVEVRNLIDEIRFDPDNPKPIEKTTQLNSEEILKLSKKVVPLVSTATATIEKSNELLQKMDFLLKRVQSKIGLDDD